MGEAWDLDCERVAAVLWSDWDPIGARAMGGPSDEYDSYAEAVVAMLRNGTDEAALARHLRMIEVDRMGLTATDRHASRAASALMALGIR